MHALHKMKGTLNPWLVSPFPPPVMSRQQRCRVNTPDIITYRFQGENVYVTPAQTYHVC
jgi:hypothetical protein